MANCPDCGTAVGQKHKGGCDIELCPRCGLQAIGCDCIYEVCGMNVVTLEQEHPNIYSDGPTPEMYERWDREWGVRAIPWSGEWPGKAECRQYGLYAKMIEGKGWQPCAPTDEGVVEDLNTLLTCARWDVDAQRWVMPS
jgi:hypothetical protein